MHMLGCGLPASSLAYFNPKLLTGMVFNPVSDPWED
jgi:hypothetical protein